MNYIYNVKNRTIREYREGAKEIDLTSVESRFIEVLANGEVNSWFEIADYIYGYHNKHTADSLRSLKSRILQKVDLKIKNTFAYGIMLKDEIYIEKERNDKNMGMAALGLTHCSKHGTPFTSRIYMS